MNCRQVQWQLLSGDAVPAAAAAHVAQCPACARAQRAAAGLRAAGRAARADDLSPAARDAVRREAARILEARRAARPAAWAVRAWRTAALAAPAAAAAALVAIVWAWSEAPPPPRAGVPPLSAAAPAPVLRELDARIDAEQRRMTARLREFQRQYRAADAAWGFDARSSRLRERLQTCAAQWAREAGGAQAPAVRAPEGRGRREVDGHDTTQQTMDGADLARGQRPERGPLGGGAGART